MILPRPEKQKKIKIFIVDDHPVLRQGLAQLINHESDLVAAGEAGDAAQTMKGIELAMPDFMIVDISLEGTSGLELTKNILLKHPSMPVLIISMYDESVYVERVLKAGARGYLTKREACDHIITAIRKILKGEIYLSDRWRDKLMQKFVGRHKNNNDMLAQGLSDREVEILQLTGQGLSTREIAGKLHVSIKTIESHYANIKNKLDLKNSHELILHAVKWCLAENQT